MILYLKDLNDPTKKSLRSDNTFHKAAGYKINIQKSVATLYTNNVKVEKESRKTISIASIK
jgi:hypothetical protein